MLDVRDFLDNTFDIEEYVKQTQNKLVDDHLFQKFLLVSSKFN